MSEAKIYTLAEIRDGTGWPEGARFAFVPQGESVAVGHYHSGTGWEDRLCDCPTRGTYAPGEVIRCAGCSEVIFRDDTGAWETEEDETVDFRRYCEYSADHLHAPA